MGFAFGTFGAGLFSDRYGRKMAIILFSQLLLITGIIATVMPNVASFAIVWFFVGMYSKLNLFLNKTERIFL